MDVSCRQWRRAVGVHVVVDEGVRGERVGVRMAAEEGHFGSHLESGRRAAVTKCEATPIAEGSFLCVTGGGSTWWNASSSREGTDWCAGECRRDAARPTFEGATSGRGQRFGRVCRRAVTLGPERQGGEQDGT